MLRPAELRKNWAYQYLRQIWQPLALLLLTVSFTAGYFANQDSDVVTSKPFFCNADGNIQTQSGGFYSTFWDPKLFLTINIAHGHFSFTTAKVIDACWDVIFGRGGQVVAAMAAYPVLRRSLSLVMETCVIPTATTTSIYCQQIQMEPMWKLLCFMLTRRDSRRVSKRLNMPGSIRLSAHLLVCAYVLSFPTLASVMTGYRPEMTGSFGYEEGKASQLKPIDDIYGLQFGLFDGERVGFSGPPIVLPDQLPDADDKDLGIMLSQSKSINDPYGTLVDYYFTCKGLVQEIFWRNLSEQDQGKKSFDCADHECSCSFNGTATPDKSRIRSQTTSKITINGKRWELSAPPLNISMASNTQLPHKRGPPATNISDFYSGQPIWNYDPGSSDMFGYDGRMITETEVKETGRCIADEAFSWGFSSLLLLTFCSCTTFFAAMLIILQTDVHLNSRLSREHQQHSIYRDVLFLAKELRSHFGDDLGELPAKEISKKVEADRDGITLLEDDPPLSRIQECNFPWNRRSKLHKGDAPTAERRLTEWSSSGDISEHTRLRAADGSKQGWASEEQSLVEGSSDRKGHVAYHGA